VKVLVVDDDLGSLLVAQATVRSLGHDCLTAADGQQAWETFRLHRPDVVITDRTMPGLDGLELCRRIRLHPDGYTYVVLLTALGNPDDVLAGMSAGADDYLTKPLDPLALEARLLAGQRVSDLHIELSRARVELSRQARTDPLTGLRNRLSLADDLDELQRLSGRYGREYCVALCDVDFFKRYNDTYGHPAGDQALRVVAATLVEQLRDVDLVYRYGGEEFLVLLPEQTLDGAVPALERVRTALIRTGVEHRSGLPIGRLTLSIGVARSGGEQEHDIRDLLAAADAALYRAKAAGRNQVCRHQHESTGAPSP
jgi:two-component system chemotaxis response regulator CheY